VRNPRGERRRVGGRNLTAHHRYRGKDLDRAERKSRWHGWKEVEKKRGMGVFAIPHVGERDGVELLGSCLKEKDA